MIFDNITKDNVAYFAATVYNNPHFTSIDQFQRDFRKISIMKKQMNKFDTCESQEEYQDYANRITNNTVIFLNTFGKEDALRILFTLMEERFLRKLRCVLDVLYKERPLIVPGVLNQDIIIEQIEKDEFFRQFISNSYKGMII